MPFVARHHADVHQHDARHRCVVRKAPREAERAAEVVHDQVHALDPELAARLLEEVRVRLDVVAEVRRDVRLAEPLACRSPPARPTAPAASTSAVQSLDEPGLPCTNTIASVASAGQASIIGASVPPTLSVRRDGVIAHLAKRRHRCPPRRRPLRRPSGATRQRAARVRRERARRTRKEHPAGPMLRLPNASVTRAMPSSNVAAENSSRSPGLNLRPAAKSYRFPSFVP